MYPDWDFETHVDALGPSQVGKTSWVIDCGREHILRSDHMVRLSWKADLYEADVAFVAAAKPDYNVVLLNPSMCDPIVPYNFFALPEGRNLSAHVSRVARVLLQTVSNQPVAEVQNYIWAAEPFLAYLATSGEPIMSAMRMFEDPKLWALRSEKVPQQYAHAMRDISRTPPSKWDYKIGALQRRLRPFATSDALRRFTSSPQSVQMGTLFQRRVSLFVNAAPSHLLDVEAAKIFLRLVLSEILQVGIENSTNRGDTYVYADEIKEYAPENFGSLIELVLGAGIKFTAVHHFAHQLDDRLQESLDNNARIKVLFGGLSPDVRRRFAEMAWVSELNEDVPKQPRISHITEYEDEPFETITSGEFGESVTTGLRLRPHAEEVVTGYDHYSMEEKLSKLAARFDVPNREYHVIFPNGRVKHMKVPTLRPYLYSSPSSVKFRETRPNAISLDEADRITTERSNDASPRTRAKKSGTLFNAQ